MKLFSWLLPLLFLSLNVFAQQEPEPSVFDQASKLYDFIRDSVFDIDSILKKKGINIYACRLENGPNAIEHKGVGACIYDSLNYTFKEKRSSTILVWIFDSKGQILAPITIKWKSSHAGWTRLVHEFLFMAFEGFFANRLEKSDTVASNNGETACVQTNVVNKDLGNLIGDLEVTFPPGLTISKYLQLILPPEKMDSVNASLAALGGQDSDRFYIKATMPYYFNKKRRYQLSGILANGNSQSASLSLVTNYNLVFFRRSCIEGSFEAEQPLLNWITP